MDKVTEILREETGSAMCDSGGHPKWDENGRYIGSTSGYGRNWERNQGRDFEAEPEATLSFKYGDIEYTKSTYHFIKENATFSEEMQYLYDLFVREHSDDNVSHMENMENFVKWLEQFGKVSGIYDEGDPFTCNTYNSDCILDQTLQFFYFECDIAAFGKTLDGAFILLQPHQGCDVRSGYPAPTAFEAGEYFLLYNDGHIGVAGHDHSWYTDDGYHWYENGPNGKQLEEYEIVTDLPTVTVTCGNVIGEQKGIFKDEPAIGDMCSVEIVDATPEEVFRVVNEMEKKYDVVKHDLELGVIYVDEDGNGYCPMTGGRLLA